MQSGISSPIIPPLSAVGATWPIRVYSPLHSAGFSNPSYGQRAQLPGILVCLSSGANLTYTVEVTGDDLDAAGYSPATGNWVPFTGLVNLTASSASTLGAAVTAIRLNVTAYTSGTATFQFIQFS